MRIVIIGSGSIGMLVTFYLTKKGHRISLLTNRQEQARVLNEKGIHLIIHDNERESVKVSADTFKDLQANGSIDLLILAVKSHQVKDVLAKLNQLHINIRAILFLQNGMAHTELLSTLEIPEVAVAVVEHGAIRENDFTVLHTGIGRLKWSYVCEGQGRIKDLLSKSTQLHFDISYDMQWINVLEQKLIVNACVNPLTGLLDIKNGELVKNDYCLSMMKMIFKEVMMILNFKQENDMWNHVKDVCLKTAENYSSMLLDLKYNRKTEIDSIIGYLVRRAKEQNQEVTILPFLLQGILAKETKVEGNVD
ncbi:2-dehydropantoate 2-reductase [Halalkalibacter alkalisediminis]|uniref:2-dehydropantoate 2-reductase n=1 Tax=Halalkalibacter alkalisediminis TaxID=935616 RepID=A0ABV6NEM0_9BACI|nr:2-dehydropantoate 2-reductase [Halalkalibacter alkalisediminis]